MHQDSKTGEAAARSLPRLVTRLHKIVAAFLLVVAGSAFALDSSEEQTVLQALQESDQFTNFLALVEQAGLTETLQSSEPVTVLAPPDSAFEDLSETTRGTLQAGGEQITNVVNGMILSGAYMLNEIQDAGEGGITPLSGEVYAVETTAGGLTVNGVGFDATDVDNTYANGVVHVTNRVLLPAELRAVEDAEREAAQETAPDATDPATPADPADPTDPDDPDRTDDETAPPATTTDPVAPSTPVAPAVPPTGTADPEPTTAFVRVVQLSPQTNVHIVINPQEEGLTPLDMSGMEYATDSGYQEIQPGSYSISATAQDGQDALFDPPTETFRAGNYYTIAITGLVVPAEDAAADEANNEGFMGWLNNLFGGDGDRDALAIRATTYQDEVRWDARDAGAAQDTQATTESRVRIIDAAPGSPAFDVVAITAEGERNTIANDMTYGDDSGTQTLDETVTDLEVTAADSEAVAVDLTGHLPLNADTTIFLIGTTFEGLPFDVMVLPNGPAAGKDRKSTR